MVHMYHGCPAAGYPREKGPRRFEEDLPADAVARRLHRLQHAPHDLVEAIHEVGKGGVYLPPAMARSRKPTATAARSSTGSCLSQSE